MVFVLRDLDPVLGLAVLPFGRLRFPVLLARIELRGRIVQLLEIPAHADALPIQIGALHPGSALRSEQPAAVEPIVVLHDVRVDVVLKQQNKGGQKHGEAHHKAEPQDLLPSPLQSFPEQAPSPIFHIRNHLLRKSIAA